MGRGRHNILNDRGRCRDTDRDRETEREREREREIEREGGRKLRERKAESEIEIQVLLAHGWDLKRCETVQCNTYSIFESLQPFHELECAALVFLGCLEVCSRSCDTL